jgi:hypothetical protein
MFKAVSLVNAARQTGKLKRRWPLRTVVVAAPENTTKALQTVQVLFLEMINIKEAKYETITANMTFTPVEEASWVSAVEADITVFISGQRDDKTWGKA